MTEIPFGYVKDGKIFRNKWDHHPDKEIGEVREQDVDKSVSFFIERFTDLVSKVNEVTTKIDESTNKGSFLMKLIHLKEQLPEHDGLGDYPSLLQEIIRYESLVKDIIQKNRSRNSEIKTALVEEADQLDDIVNWNEATEKAHDLKARWIKTGSAEEDKNAELEEAFWGKVSRFFDRKKQFYEDKQKLTHHRTGKYEELVNEAQKLSELHGKQRFDRVKELKEKWKENGGIPAEIYQPLHDAFQKALKGGKKVFQKSSMDFKAILEKLEGIKAGSISFDKKEMDTLKKSIYNDRGRSPEKHKTLMLISLLMENDFLVKIANKRASDFGKLEKDRQNEIKVKILKELIQRDLDDLKVYEENSANFSSSDGSMNRLVENKIKGQKKKIEIKSTLLEQINSGEF